MQTSPLNEWMHDFPHAFSGYSPPPGLPGTIHFAGCIFRRLIEWNRMKKTGVCLEAAAGDALDATPPFYALCNPIALVLHLNRTHKRSIAPSGYLAANRQAL